MDELMELLKKAMPIEYKYKALHYYSNGEYWRVSDSVTCNTLYRGDSLIEALKILTEEGVK